MEALGRGQRDAAFVLTADWRIPLSVIERSADLRLRDMQLEIHLVTTNHCFGLPSPCRCDLRE